MNNQSDKSMAWLGQNSNTTKIVKNGLREDKKRLKN